MAMSVMPMSFLVITDPKSLNKPPITPTFIGETVYTTSESLVGDAGKTGGRSVSAGAARAHVEDGYLARRRPGRYRRENARASRRRRVSPASAESRLRRTDVGPSRMRRSHDQGNPVATVGARRRGGVEALGFETYLTAARPISLCLVEFRGVRRAHGFTTACGRVASGAPFALGSLVSRFFAPFPPKIIRLPVHMKGR